jgi:Mrp family chromosome partitioning ATPase
VAQVFIEQETGRQQARFQSGLDELEAQTQALVAAIATTQVEIASLGDPEGLNSDFARLELARLESRLNRDQTRLVVLLTSAEEFRMAMARYTDDISVFAPAELPGAPVGPGTSLNVLLGGIVGLLIGCCFSFLLEYLDDTVKSPEDVKQQLSTRVMGALPEMGANKGALKLIVAEQPRLPIAEAFRSLRTSLHFSNLDQPPRSVVVTSPQPSDGKTFVAANLAAVLAQGDYKVVLVDADLRNPRQHHLFKLQRAPGLTDVLLSWRQFDAALTPDASEDAQVAAKERRRLQAALQPTTIDDLRLVTSGQHTLNPAEILDSAPMRGFLAWLQEQADIVIVDSPPVLAVTDAAVLSSQADGTLLIVDSGETRITAASRALERLGSVDANVLGVVVNRLAASANGYYQYCYYHGAKERGGTQTGFTGRLGRLVDQGRSELRSLRHKGTGGRR